MNPATQILIHYDYYQYTWRGKCLQRKENALFKSELPQGSQNWFYDSNASNEIVQKQGIGNKFVGTNKYGTGSGIQYLTGVYTSP
jgi:hypothetical protein